MPLADGFVANPRMVEHYGPTWNQNQSSIFNALPQGGSMPDRNWSRLRRPYLDDRGRACVAVRDIRGGWTRNDSHGGERRPLVRAYLVNDLRNQGYNLPMVVNATTLRKEDWIQLDRQIVRSARQRLKAWNDLLQASSFGGFNAMGKMTLEYQAMSDPGEAVVDMDARTTARNDTPLFILRSLPLPITHSDFGYSSRELMVSRNSNTPLDTAMGESAGRRVAEMVEDTLIGNQTGITYATQTTGPGTHTGTSTVYGYTNFPQRLTKINFTAPTVGGWVPDTTHNEMLAALDQIYLQGFYGPFVIYHSTDWTQYMNRVYAVSGGNNPGETLRTMLLKNPDILDVRRLDRLLGVAATWAGVAIPANLYTFIIVQMTSEVAQAINGMDITTVQWQQKGGLDLCFKVMCIQVPRLRSDYSSRTGILHGTTA